MENSRIQAYRASCAKKMFLRAVGTIRRGAKRNVLRFPRYVVSAKASSWQCDFMWRDDGLDSLDKASADAGCIILKHDLKRQNGHHRCDTEPQQNRSVRME